MKKEGLTSLNPYLTFEGECREAMEFYASALGAELSVLPFRGSPMEKDVPEKYKDKVMHARLTYENIVLMASDALPDEKVTLGNNTALSIASSSLEEARRFFAHLSEGGTVLMDFQKTFWGAEFGMCNDRFGFIWMVNFEPEEEK
jgi:PhnB protein